MNSNGTFATCVGDCRLEFRKWTKTYTHAHMRLDNSSVIVRSLCQQQLPTVATNNLFVISHIHRIGLGPLGRSTYARNMFAFHSCVHVCDVCVSVDAIVHGNGPTRNKCLIYIGFSAMYSFMNVCWACSDDSHRSLLCEARVCMFDTFPHHK